MFLRAVCHSFLAALLLGATCHAGLLIEIGEVTLAAGSTGYVDVTISSDSGDSLDAFVINFLISGPGVEFATGPGEPDDLQLSDPDYVFPLGNSLAAVFGPSAGVVGISTVSPNDTYSGSDATIDGLGAVVPTTNRLLARLHLIATTALPGDQVSLVMLDSTSGYPGLASVFYSPTWITDPAGSELAFSSVAGRITVAAVPEPGGATLLLGAMIVVHTIRRISVGRFRPVPGSKLRFW